ncbi:MAG TPA: ribonuclease HII [bacterium]|nr:ribonuclease HII [bacterium]HOL47526.1 ribonuclease HII [bacterium]HPQ19122.1 ribonuclease HII [bacterium]
MKILENNSIYYYEDFYTNKIIAGSDEVGRGPLAGPVFAAIVILKKNEKIIGLKDSKKLTSQKREKLCKEILSKSLDWSIGIVDNEIIDKINILEATKLSIKIAYKNLKIKPDILLIDALKIPEIDCEQISIIKGDEKVASIAAASIVAKVFRDQLMNIYSEIYPMYNFSKNKGYGTKEHIEKIMEFGASPIHRKSFKIKY